MNARDAKKIEFPEHLMVQTTSRCNSACVICPWPDTAKAQAQGDMDDDLYLRIVSEVKTFPNLSRVMLYLMNEPLLDAKLPVRADLMRKALPRAEIYILTNGILLEGDLAERLIDSGLSWIGISVHAIDPETYKTITGRPDFAKIRDRLDRFVDRAMAARGEDFVQVNVTRIRPHVSEEEFERAAAHWREAGVRRVDLDNGYISRAGNVEVYGHDPIRTTRTSGCKTIWAYKMAHVLYNGDVLPCCMDWRRKVVFGNVRDAGGLLSAWRGPGRVEFLDRLGSGDVLPDDFLCVRCEDAIGAEDLSAGLVAESASTVDAASESDDADHGKNEKAAETAPDILLFNPPPWLVSAPPLGLAAIAAYLRERGRKVRILDGNIRVYQAAEASLKNLWQWERGEFWEDYGKVEAAFGAELRKLADEAADSGARVVGVNIVSRKECAASIFLARLKERNPDIKAFLGGPGVGHVELRKHIRTLCQPFIDGFIVGEGELATEELLRRLGAGEELRGMPGLAQWKTETGEEVFEDGPVLGDLASLPIPDFSDFDLTSYESPSLVVEWNRGCVGRCTFCNINDLWKRMRYKTADQVIVELKSLTERHGVNIFSVVDPMVNADPELLDAICTKIIGAGLDIRWSAGISPNRTVSAELFAKMAKAGCYRLEFGVESGCDEVLRRMGKSYRPDLAAQMVRDAHAAGIMIVAYLIVGFPRETEEDFRQTLAFIEGSAASIDLVRSVNGLVIIHGTDVEKKPEAFGIDPQDRLASGWTTRWTSGDNTPEVRAERVERVRAKLAELGIPVEFENIDDVMPRGMLYEKRLENTQERLDKISDDLRDLIGKIDKVMRGEPVRPVPGFDQVALAICPVWGVDMPPLGLAALAGFLRNQGYSPVVFDFNVELFRNSPPEMKPFFEENSFRHWTDADGCRRIVAAFSKHIDQFIDGLLATGRKVLGFSVYSPNRLFTIEVMRRVKRRDPSRILVAGGRGVSTVNERLLFPPGAVDFFVVGDGETTFVPLLEDLFAGRSTHGLPGIDYFIGHNLAGLIPRPPLQDLTLLPPPAYDLLDLSIYRTDEIPVQFSRGCISHCTFCNDNHNVMGFRTRTGAHMASELAHHIRTLGRRKFRFNDQLINGDLKLLEDLCDEVIRQGLGIEWIALFQPRGDMSDELPQKMARAGCYTVNMGVESGSDNVLKRMAKGFRVAEMERSLRQMRQAGINTMLNFIVGFPGETEADLEETIAFIQRNREWICGVTSVNSCILLEDSAIDRNAEKLGIAFPDMASRDVNWVMGDNTPESRRRRLDRFIGYLADAKIPFLVSNAQERAADISFLPEIPAPPSPPESAPAAKGAACGCDDDFDPAKGEPRFETIPAEPADILLIKCPVWGVDVAPLAIAVLSQACREKGQRPVALDLNVKIHNRHCDRGLWRMDRYKEWTSPEFFPRTYEALWEMTSHYLSQIAAHPAKIVGFSLCTANYLFTLETSRRLREMAPEKTVIFGGPGITNSYDVFDLTGRECDYMFFGEADLALPEIVSALKKGRAPEGIEGLVKAGEKFTYESVKRAIVPRGTALPTPTMEELNLWEYAGNAVPLLGSRGCVRKCAFCNDHQIYQKYRPRTGKEIFADMDWYVRRLGAVHFTFLDLLMNGHMGVLEEFCDLVIASGYKVHWGCQCIVRKEMTREILDKMARAGCQSIVFGMESFSDKVLRLMRKNYTQELAKRVLADATAAGMEAIINIIVGFPGEGVPEFLETYNFIRDNRDIIGQVASVSPCLVNLGSELFDRYGDFGIIFSETDGSVKWFTADGSNTYEERLRRVLAITGLLAGRDKPIHTVNIYDSEDQARRVVDDEKARAEVRNGEQARTAVPAAAAPEQAGESVQTEPTIISAAPAERLDAVIALPPPWGVNFPPLGLATLAATAREKGFRIEARDLNILGYGDCGEYLKTWWLPENLKYWTPEGRLSEIWAFLAPMVQEFVNEVANLSPRVLGLSTNESNLAFACRIAQKIRAAAPQVKIIFGGPGVAWPADRIKLKGESIDGFVVGEGEIAFPALLEALRNGSPLDGVPGFESIASAPAKRPSAETQVRSLDSLPVPLFDDFPLSLYRTRELPLLMGRGCVNRCTFCNDHKITPKYRYKTAEKLAEEVKLYKKLYGGHDFMFCDLILNAHRANLLRFAEKIVQENIRMSYSGQALIDPKLDPKDFELLRRSGCASLVFGVESFSDKVLALMKKGYSAKDARKTMAACKKAGIGVIVNLIVGFPGETDAELSETIAFLKKNRGLIDSVSALSTCIVTPNCAIEGDPEKFGVVLPQPEHWCQWHTKDSANTYDIRYERLARVLDVLDELGIPHGMTNRYLEAVGGEI